MSYTLLNNALAQPLPPARRMVLLALADAANHAGVCWPSVTTLAKRCCLSVRSVFDHLKALVAAGLLSRRQRIGRASVYTVTATPEPPTAAPQPEVTPAQPPAPETPPAPDLLVSGSVVTAMRTAGLLGAYDCPTLAALVHTAHDGMAEFTSVAAEAVRKGKGFPWALATIRGRRADVAQATATTPPSKPGRDPVLIQLEHDAAQAAPPPAGIRARLAQLRASLTGANTCTLEG